MSKVECSECSIKKDLVDCFQALKDANAEIEHLLAESLAMKLALEKKIRLLANDLGENVQVSSEDFYANKVALSNKSKEDAVIQRKLIVDEMVSKYSGKRVLFVIPLGIVTGGGNVVVNEAYTLRKFGIDACILNLESERDNYNKNYGKYEVPTFFVKDFEETLNICDFFDVVCATSWQTIYVAKFVELSKRVKVAYYMQDYEPFFYDENLNEMYTLAKDSYSLVDGIKIVTKTKWNQEILEKELGINSILLAPSVNTDTFAATNANCHGKVRISAMVRPYSPIRSPELTMHVLKRVYEIYKENIEIHIFGNSFNDDARFFLDNETDFEFVNHELTDSQTTAIILASSDIFVDFSSYQAMGLTGLEAMLCGCAVILPQNGGATSYAVDNVNSLVIDTSDEENCFDALKKLIYDKALREKLSVNAISNANQYYPERAAALFATAVFN